MKSQKQKILSWLKSGRTLTSRQCREKFNHERLAARIREFRKAGIPIETIFIKKGRSRFAKYQLS